MDQASTGTGTTPRVDERALKILAKSVYRELKSSGYSRSDMVGFTNALLDLVTSDMKGDGELNGGELNGNGASSGTS